MAASVQFTAQQGAHHRPTANRPSVPPRVRLRASKLLIGNVHWSAHRPCVVRGAWGEQKEKPKGREQGPKPAGLSFQTVSKALWEVHGAWDAADVRKRGNLDLPEAVALLNSQRIRDATLVLANVEATHWTEADLAPLFKEADVDHSGALSKQEFLALYLRLVARRVQHNPLVLAEALLGVLDINRDGRIEGGELKVLLALLGFPAALLLPIPKQVGVDYRAVLRSLPGGGPAAPQG